MARPGLQRGQYLRLAKAADEAVSVLALLAFVENLNVEQNAGLAHEDFQNIGTIPESVRDCVPRRYMFSTRP